MRAFFARAGIFLIAWGGMWRADLLYEKVDAAYIMILLGGVAYIASAPRE